MPSTISFSADLRDSSDNVLKDVTVYQRSIDQTKFEVKVIVPRKNELYKLNMFAGKFIGKLWIKRERGENVDDLVLYRNYNNFDVSKAYVFSPIEQRLKRNHSCTFKVHSKIGEKVALVYKTSKSSDWLYMEKNADKNNTNWSMVHQFDQTGSIDVFVMVNNKWEALCGYEIV